MAVVFRVYGQKLDENLVFVISDRGTITKFPGVSEFDVANVLRACEIEVRVDDSIPISKVMRKYAINPYA